MLLDSFQAFFYKYSPENTQQAPSLCLLWKDWICIHFLMLQQCASGWTLKIAVLLLPWEVPWLQIARHWEVRHRTLGLVLCSSLAIVSLLLPGTYSEMGVDLGSNLVQTCLLAAWVLLSPEKAFSVALEMKTGYKWHCFSLPVAAVAVAGNWGP